MADLAQIGLSYDPSGGKAAEAGLQAIIPPARAAQQAVDKTSSSLGNVAGSSAKAAAGLREIASGGSAAATQLNAIASGSSNAANGVTRLAEGYDVLTGKINGNFLAIGNNLQRLGLLGNQVNNVGKSLKFTATEGLNFSRQLADIGVTAAMGMNPLMIAIQQGPQLFDILQMSAQRNMTTIGAVARAAGAQIWAAMAPLLPLIAGITAVVGTVAAAFSLGARSINKDNKDIVGSLGLTEKQLERVKKSGVDTAVTMGDTFFAFFDVVGDRLTDAFEGPLKWLSDAISSTLDFITEYSAKALKFIIGGFVGAVYGIKASWELLPKALGDIFYTIANVSLKALELFINAWIDGINYVIKWANETLGTGFGELGDVSLGQLQNDFAGGAKSFTEAFAQGMSEGMDAAGGAIDRFWSDVGKRARERREAAIREAAGDPEKGSKGRKGGKSDAEKFADIVDGINEEIAATEVRTKALAMGADEALRFTNEQNALAEAQKKGIVLTDGQTSALRKLAGQLTDAQIAFRNADTFKNITEGLDDQLRGAKQAGEQIGKYGIELDKLRLIQEAMNEAQAKDVILSEQQIAAIEGKADAIARQNDANARSTFLEDAIKKTEQLQFAMERERGELGLVGAELAAYRYETELLADARQRNINLDDAAITGIRETARAYGEVRDAIDKAASRLAALNGMMGGGSVGKLMGALTSGDPISGLLGMGGAGSIIGLMTKGGQSAFAAQGKMISKSLTEVFGISGPFAKTLTGALQGAGVGEMAGSILGNSQANKIGGMIGGAAGKALGSAIAGPIGGMIGSVLGGLAGSALGSVFKKDKYGTATITGLKGFGTSGNNDDSKSGAGTFASNLQKTIGNLANALDTTVGAFKLSVGITNGKININPGTVTGMVGTTKQKNTIDFGKDEAAAMRYAIEQVFAQGAFQGLSEGWKNFVLSNPDDLEGQVSKLVDLKNAYDELDRIKDPQRVDLTALDKMFDALRDTATKAGDDLARIEELYGIKRKEIADKYLEADLALTRERREMEAELLRLSGDELGAVAIARQLEREQLDPTLRGLYDTIAAKKDEIAANEALAASAAAAAAASDRVLGLQIRLSKANGDDMTATALERMMELNDAQSEQERSMLRQIYAVEDATVAQDRYTEALSMQAAMFEAVTGRMRGAAAGLREFADELFGKESVGDVDAMRRRVLGTIRLAGEGDMKAAEALPGLMEAYLPYALKASGSKSDYYGELSTLQNLSRGTADITDARATVEQINYGNSVRQMLGWGDLVDVTPFYEEVQRQLAALNEKVSQADRNNVNGLNNNYRVNFNTQRILGQTTNNGRAMITAPTT